MALTLAALAKTAQAQLRGDPDRLIDSVATLQDAHPGAISFLANPKYRAYLETTRASAVILDAENAGLCPVDCLISDNPYLAHARVMAALYPEPRYPAGIDGSAVVDPSARVAPTASIGAQSFVGAGAEIGEDVIVGPGCMVMEGATIGAGSRLVAMVTLCHGTVLGRRCLVHPGAVIGGDGFGLANDAGRWVKVQQVGRAVLGDDVEVGSCTSIDRGAIEDTVIADGVKLDSQVHIAHNVKVGEHTAMAGCAAVAGSSTIGSHCTIAGGAGLTGHIELADHVHVSGATAVTRSIRKPGVYTGTVPAIEHADWLKNFARLRHLDDLARRIKSLERELAALRQQHDKAGD
ncbi:MAG: UDP-3-O-(3-hydroxymyristoyl)glucosamine N-acyltransferase [Gammaproteobacteria bacterium]|nr:UDP-3-O-(3-hydroxymyristoyl)glucosamine N-acyltransferase [Gammaproteobacteria bacterium]MCP5298948.1 UDP-3-O-(3-hydroxymyristoyl)glucosamine N-acyltransferase [Chromatiaceae bacterium]